MKSLKRSMKAGLILMAVGAGLLAYSSDVDSVSDTPKLISAILKEDIELYSKQMSRLLNQPMAEFKEVVSFKTEQGDTIFHLMAGVKSHQEFFAKELRALTFLADLGSRLKGSKEEKKNLSLGGVNIEIPYLEDTELGQAIYNQDVSTVVSIANQLGQMPAIKLFQYSHAKTKEERSLKNLAFSKMNMNDLLYLRDQNVEEKIREYTLPFFYEIKNKKGLLPKHISEAEGNLSAYSVLAGIKSLEDFSTKDIFMVVGGTITGFTAMYLGVGVGLGAGWEVKNILIGATGWSLFGVVGGGFVAGACYELFQNKKLKRMSNKANAI